MSDHTNHKKPTADRIKATLSTDLADLTVEQLAALAKFVHQVGGIERAHQAIESLEKLKHAA
jgi:hypothetical protein